jgi:hypothetical protein
MPRAVNRYEEARQQGRLWVPQIHAKVLPLYWFEADFGCSASGWVNQGTAGGTVPQATGGSQPAVIIDTNGKPAVNFATSKYYGPLSASGPSGTTDWTVFAFGKFSTGDIKAIMGWGWDLDQVGISFYTGAGVGNDGSNYEPQLFYTATSVETGQPASILGSFGSAAGQAFLNGAAATLTTDTPAAKGNITSRNIYLGSTDGSVEFGDHPAIKIIGWFPGVVHSQDMQRVMAYAHWKHGEQWRLLGGSYANMPPLLTT